jgi:hypothetical protein
MNLYLPNNHFKSLDCVGGSKSGQQNMGSFLSNRAFFMQNQTRKKEQRFAFLLKSASLHLFQGDSE